MWMLKENKLTRMSCGVRKRGARGRILRLNIRIEEGRLEVPLAEFLRDGVFKPLQLKPYYTWLLVAWISWPWCACLWRWREIKIGVVSSPDWIQLLHLQKTSSVPVHWSIDLLIWAGPGVSEKHINFLGVLWFLCVENSYPTPLLPSPNYQTNG